VTSRDLPHPERRPSDWDARVASWGNEQQRRSVGPRLGPAEAGDPLAGRRPDRIAVALSKLQRVPARDRLRPDSRRVSPHECDPLAIGRQAGRSVGGRRPADLADHPPARHADNSHRPTGVRPGRVIAWREVPSLGPFGRRLRTQGGSRGRRSDGRSCRSCARRCSSGGCRGSRPKGRAGRAGRQGSS